MDLLDMLQELDAPELLAPQGWTENVYPAAEFERSFSAWVKENGHFNAYNRYPGWMPLTLEHQPEGSGHSYEALEARRDGARVNRAFDDACGWASSITAERDVVIVEWLDHAWHGWRDLPIIEGRRAGDDDTRWIREVTAQHPPEWARPGAPIITARGSAGTRSVPGGSPWGGFNLSHTILEAA